MFKFQTLYTYRCSICDNVHLITNQRSTYMFTICPRIRYMSTRTFTKSVLDWNKNDLQPNCQGSEFQYKSITDVNFFFLALCPHSSCHIAMWCHCWRLTRHSRSVCSTILKSPGQSESQVLQVWKCQLAHTDLHWVAKRTRK